MRSGSGQDNILNMFLHLRDERARRRERKKKHRHPGEKRKFLTRRPSRRNSRQVKVLFPKDPHVFHLSSRHFSFLRTKATSRIYDLAVDRGNTRSFSIRRNDVEKKRRRLFLSAVRFFFFFFLYLETIYRIFSEIEDNEGKPCYSTIRKGNRWLMVQTSPSL